MKNGQYGFAMCAESHAAYGDDVFLHSSRALAFAAQEEHELQALLVYLRGRDAAWVLLRDCTVHHRACIFRSLDLAAVVDPKYKLKCLICFGRPSSVVSLCDEGVGQL